MHFAKRLSRETFAQVPPHVWFVCNAAFRYCGPSFAVLLFSHMEVMAVAWFRICGAAVALAVWVKPWRIAKGRSLTSIGWVAAFGLCITLMNIAFYLSIERLPLSLVASIEFLGSILVALIGLRTAPNYIALAVAVTGVFLLTELRWSDDIVGLIFAAMNTWFFIVYIMIGHRIAGMGIGSSGVRIGAAMMFAALFITPAGIAPAASYLKNPLLVLAGFGVGICSSVIPYVCDQLAMERLPRSSFALLLAIFPATAALIGAVLLGQIPTPRDLLGIGLVMLAITIHKPSA